MTEDEPEDGPDGLATVCNLCQGTGMVPDPKLAVMAGRPLTLDNGRPCPHCGGNHDARFPGIVPPA